jgi:hypothetical protein
MATKKKPSVTPGQTKSEKAVAAPAAVRTRTAKTANVKPIAEKPESKGVVFVLWVIAVVIVLTLLTSPYLRQVKLQEIQWPQIEWPEINITLPNMPDFSGFFAAKPLEEKTPEKPVMPVVIVEEKSPEEIQEAEELKRQLAEAQSKIQQLETTVQEKDKALQYEITMRGQTLLAQYARLIEHALQKGLPFPWELEQLQHFSDSHMPEAASLVQALAPYVQGVASYEKLRTDFRTVSDDIYVRWKKEDTDSGLSAAIARMLRQLISIRRVGLVEGSSPDAIVARAEYYLNKENIERAAEELSAFQGSYATIVAPWIAEVKLRLEALKLTQSLHTLAQKVAPNPALDAPKNTTDLVAPPLTIEAR